MQISGNKRYLQTVPLFHFIVRDANDAYWLLGVGLKITTGEYPEILKGGGGVFRDYLFVFAEIPSHKDKLT